MPEELSSRPPVPSTQPSFAVQPTGKKRRLILIALGVVLLIVVGALGWYIFSQSTASPDDTFLGGLLPGAPDAEVLPTTPEATPVSESGTDTPLPTTTGIPLVPAVPQTQEKLAVNVNYRRDSTFTLTIGAITKTYENSTIESYQPVAGQPFSLLRLVNAQGATLYEAKFTVTTDVVLDGVGPGQTGTYPINESSARLVLDLLDTTATKVQVLTGDGRVLDEAPVDLKAVPFETYSVQSGSDSSAAPPHFIPQAHAASPPNDRYKIVVIGENGANTGGALSATQGITSYLEPWVTFRDKVEIVAIQGVFNLGCQEIVVAGGSVMPICPDNARVISSVASVHPDWNAIVVAHPSTCGCGTVGGDFPTIAVVGVGVTSDILGHELGHAIGKMVDEYYYQLGITEGPLGTNCFSSEASCQQQILSYPGAFCAAGCRTVSSFRPATMLMHGLGSPAYGPLEECVMGRAIGRVIGETYTKCGTGGTSPTPGTVPKGFYGWHR